MALSIQTLEMQEDELLRDYMKLLSRTGRGDRRLRSPGHDLRTCADCGTRTAFTLDPEGTWFRCSHCGAYA